jgi:nicotinic acid mononucleotide adenylyltransferase
MIDSIIEILFEEDYSKKVIIYVGGFKPPTKGHFDVAKNALEDFSDADEFIIYVGGGVRDNITQEESIKIWDIYRKYLSPKVKIEPSSSPIKSVFDYAKQNPEEEIYWVLGVREGNEDDLADFENRTKSLDKYPNIVTKIITTPGGVSGTKTRQALKLKDKEQFFKLIPDIEEKEQIWDMVSPIVKEEGITEVGEANLTPYKWEEVNASGWFTSVKFITDNETEYDVRLENTIYVDNELNNLLALEIEFTAKPKGTESKSSKIVVNKGEMYKVMSTLVDIVKNYIKEYEAQAIIYYPAKKSSEEDFGTQRDNLYKAFISKAIPDIKFESTNNVLYDKGIVAILPDSINEVVTDTDIICDNCGWDWKIADGGDDLYVCHKCGHDNNPDLEEGKKNKDPEKGTGKKPKGSGRRLYTDENPKDTVSIKFKTKEDIVDTLNKESFKSKSHARQSQIINVIHQRVRAAYSKAKDPEVKSRLKRALDYIESRKEASKEKTERLRKMKEASDPQAGTALPYGSGFAPVKEKSDPFGLNEYAKTLVKEVFKETSDLKESILSLSKYMLENGLNIKPLPKVKFINNDEENASKILGKTAHYNPADKSITLYTFGRHPKDILRSFSHEMIHHMQNLEGRLDNITTTNTNEDGDLPEIEKEAYEKGNMMLRNWEDGIKNV